MAQNGSYIGLARKWRPQTFEDLVGQEAVRESFQQALRGDRVAHGHLLAGPRGVGKTTSARILARALNCSAGERPTPTPCGKCRHCIDIAIGNDLDVIEIDAASNTKVEQMRELLERVMQAPFAARYKVYIIDEVHMLSIHSFNALLKTLEEPPPHVVFIFATTDPEEVPETVLSRCVLHAFRRLTAEDIMLRLAQVAEGEGVKLDPAAAREIFGPIARSVEGGMRDALVIFDQLLALTDGKPDVESTLKLLGLADRGVLADAVKWLAAPAAADAESGSHENATRLLALVDDLVTRGRSLERFVKSLVAYLRDLMLLQAGAGETLVNLSGDALSAAQAQSRDLSPTALYNILNHMFELEEKLKTSTQARFLLEFTFLRLAAVKPVVPIEEIMKRIQAVPDQAFSAAPHAPPAAAPRAESGGRMNMEPREQPSGPARGSAALVMNDSLPTLPASARSSIPANLPAGPSGEELVAQLAPQLPDSMRFLERYLRQAARLRVEGACLEIGWPEGMNLGRRMIERAENTQAIESSLTQLLGRPMRLRSFEIAADSAEFTASAAGHSPSSGGASVPDPPRRTRFIPGDDALPGASPGAADDESEDAEPDVTEPRTAITPPAVETSRLGPNLERSTLSSERGAAVVPASAETAPPADTRNAREKAQAFLARGGEIAKRAKMLREMFHGRAIDEQGQPISI